jgi:hemoglobin/transferrin/lactoferrin receptor protein
MPSWSVLKLSSSYSFSKRLNTVIILDNLLDVHYREFASGISAPGRNLNIVLSYQF